MSRFVCAYFKVYLRVPLGNILNFNLKQDLRSNEDENQNESILILNNAFRFKKCSCNYLHNAIQLTR